MKCILIVDDHQMARRALKLFLEQQEYVCEEAEHGEERRVHQSFGFSLFSCRYVRPYTDKK